MKNKKIGDYVLSVLYLFIAIWLLFSDFPFNYFASFILFLAALMNWLKTVETDYCQRASRRLSQVVLFLSLFLLIKIWLLI